MTYQLEGTEELYAGKKKAFGNQRKSGSDGLFQGTGGRDGTALQEADRLVTAPLRENKSTQLLLKTLSVFYSRMTTKTYPSGGFAARKPAFLLVKTCHKHVE